MAKVLVVTSGKGGVGKTTSTAALGAALRAAAEAREAPAAAAGPIAYAEVQRLLSAPPEPA